MFTRWGRFVYRRRRVVLAVMVIALLIAGGIGLGLGSRLSQSGYDDPASQSTQAAQLADATFGRDHGSDILVLYTAPEGKTVDDPQLTQEIQASLDRLKTEHPGVIGSVISYWSTHATIFTDDSKQHAFARVELTGNTDTETLNQFKTVKNDFDIPGVKVEVSGLQPIGDAIGNGMEEDTRRAEVIALPLVALLLFFVFGGVVAASLPVIIGVLTIAGATGAMWVMTHFMDINTFASPVISLIGLGLAIDYGLFIVSRFREEIAEGYDTGAAVRRTVMTAGRTVVFSATLLLVCMGGLLMFPQGFLKSVALGGIFAVAFAAIASLTVLPALLGMLGHRVDALGLKFLRRTKTQEEIESGFWARTTDWVMKHPAVVAAPIVIVMLLLIVPFKNIQFGGLSETYLPPNNPTRVAQEHFDELFPKLRTDPINLVIENADSQQLSQIARAANQVPGFTGKFTPSQATTNGVDVLSSTLVDSMHPQSQINALRAIPAPDGVRILVGGTPASNQDSIDAVGARLPFMVIFVILVTTILMFLAFGSLVLPIKAVLMSALSLGSTLGILTWIFIDGHGSGISNFTPGPLMVAVIPLMLAILFGLSTDYEVFLLSRMVEAREQGATTTEAIRAGTAHTGRIITAAALILIMVTGAFGFSEIVMMKYIAYGMIAALILDATVIRMLLVPAVMQLLGDDCWWAPQWMKKIQRKIGLGEIQLENELGDRPAPVRDREPLTEAIPRITADLTPAFAADAPAPVKPSAPQPRPKPATGGSGGAAAQGGSESGPRATSRPVPVLRPVPEPRPAPVAKPAPEAAPAPAPRPAPVPSQRQPAPAPQPVRPRQPAPEAARPTPQPAPSRPAPTPRAMPWEVATESPAAPESAGANGSEVPRPGRRRRIPETEAETTSGGRHRGEDGPRVTVSELLRKHRE
ncbi:MMPL family transporter [Rhodococcus sp. D2-41]|uniref:MMPL family transporter n=1 Tax=Speluncibacter jeojiensis TaxID=2710754 RepID=A0A9X4M0L6_9ACTN|nr:MMPL family transporter [Rhodococcus sp. D2-41]MDG3010306.1 MMPL family transporter [Rhodococcus sp. D2-41]MDG3015819.1 MMPL family transporter [Corynebacteriales bacterium D3-21]